MIRFAQPKPKLDLPYICFKPQPTVKSDNAQKCRIWNTYIMLSTPVVLNVGLEWTQGPIKQVRQLNTNFLSELFSAVSG